MTLEEVNGEIVLNHVSFKYPTRPDVQIFKDLCLTIHSGKTVALVGESGSGKSTVISLLQRFYDPDSGNITLDGKEIQRLQVKWLRQQMGLVSQEPVLFNETIRANIAYGKGGDATEAEIIAAAELANAHNFISGLQKGYDTIVGERGVQLSGGQKQRVAIARAIVKNPKILLLDEATSALDAESEKVVQDALDRVMVDRTTIVVAHRLSTIKGADLIAVVKNGVIAEKGKHEALLHQGGQYASLVALHTSASSSYAGQEFADTKGAAASIFSILDRKSQIDASDESGMTLEEVNGEIVLNHVSFKYPTRPDVQIFKDLCLTIHSGKTVALVGESGSGKSTVISLLQRFYDPDSGNITLDGKEIQRLQVKWLRQQMGLVSQEPVLFNETIRANIAYGKGGDATEAEIIAAAELANAHNFISGLQKGYDTIVGERGVQLSGGQKQRVAIARAIVKNPKILLLDEATSALDAESEKVVQDALDRVMVDRTTIVVAHRLSTIKGADLIAVVKNGVIAEKGKHEALLHQGGQYASLVALHTSASSS
ncbi:ABC transporter B family member 11-like [Lotus japonicus]|uniref:ABC transporter B family member 11-like n=1 Tax=Lotus japonicus TaxID=34305 RepID=UPI00258DF6AD|nr:ABC transporter B family member 11-like [Lotus japonicus]